jgi:hypothetical protein
MIYRDDLDTARGIVRGLLLAAAIWVILSAILWGAIK